MENVGQLCLDVSHERPQSSTRLGALLNLTRLFSLHKRKLLSAAGESTASLMHWPLDRFLLQAQVGSHGCLAILFKNSLLKKSNTNTT